LQIVVNGEFYDHERIQRELIRRRHRPRTRSDNEIALHLDEDRGSDCLRHLRGEFAFALWDGRERRLFAARDRLGIKPLCYAQRDGLLYLASEAKTLFAARIPARWDRSAFFQLAGGQHHDRPQAAQAVFGGGRRSGRLAQADRRPGLVRRARRPLPLNQSLYLWSKVVLPNDAPIFLGDRMEMVHSIEGGVPFLDHRLVELCRDLPVSQKIRGMIEKHVLREAARPVLTATIYGRHKHPFVAPPAALEREGRLYELTQDTLCSPTLAALPFFDRDKVVALLDALPALDEESRTAYDPALMILLSACALHAGYGLSADGAKP